jgi:polar amino acid transport system substrate-binding protein
MRRRHWLLAGSTALTGRAAAGSCGRPLLVGVSPLGWGVFEANGKLQGIVPDLVERLSQRSGCRLELSLRPRARVMLDFQNAEIDLVTSALRTADRDAVGDYLPYAFSGFDLLAHPSVPTQIASVAALETDGNQRLGLVRGIQLTPRLMAAVERLVSQGRVEWASDFHNLAARLTAERFGSGIFPTVIHGKLKQDGLLPASFRSIELPDSPPQPIGLYLQRKRMNETQRKQVLDALRELVRDGELPRIYARYLGEAATQRLFSAGRAANGPLPI